MEQVSIDSASREVQAEAEAEAEKEQQQQKELELARQVGGKLVVSVQSSNLSS